MQPWPISASLSAEIVVPAALPAILVHWHDLAGRALEPNCFYAPAHAMAALAHLPERHGATVALAWRGEGETRRLVGLLPLVRARGRYLNPLRVRRAAAFYGTLSTPLLDPDRPAETLRALLAAAGTGAVLFPFLHEEGPVAAALAEAAELPRRRLAAHRRAFLRSPLSGADYVRATLEARRRKEADRQRRRLADEGALAFAVATAADDVASALDAFLDLEAAGWKGRAGTALRTVPGGVAFVRAAAAEGARGGAFRVATLSLDGRPIAAGLVAVAGRRAFYLKTAYDEALARFSPGLLLTLDLTAHLLDDPAIDDADSIAIADHPMIDRIWTERVPVAAILVGTRPGAEWPVRAAAAFERLREAAVDRAKAASVELQAFRKARAHAGGKDSAASR